MKPIPSNESPLAHTPWIKTIKKEKVSDELFAIKSVLSAFLQNYFCNGKIGSKAEWRRCIHIPPKKTLITQHFYK